MKKIDIKKNSKKKFNAFIKEIMSKLHVDQIQEWERLKLYKLILK